MIQIMGKDGSSYQYNEAMGFVIKDGVVQSSAEYEPLYIPGSTEVCGIQDKMAGKVITLTGDIGDLKGGEINGLL